MIGHVSIGKSFHHCISYVLEDKRHLSEEAKQNLSEQDGVRHKNRAEVLYYNQCFGSKKDLVNDLKEVAALSSRVEKPVLHLSLRPAPGEIISRENWLEIAETCAKKFGIADHQYLCVLHRDTSETHLHIVANRVGFDGKAISSSNNFKKMAECCRELEQKFGLQQVLSPKKFLPEPLKNIPRKDSRKDALRRAIKEVLQRVNNYSAFEREMKLKGYQVIKGRGISFIDSKKVKIKGSEVGLPLSKIEQALLLRQQLNILEQQKEKMVRSMLAEQQKPDPDGRPRRMRMPREIREGVDNFFSRKVNFVQSMLHTLLKPEPEQGRDVSLTPQPKKKRRRPG